MRSKRARITTGRGFSRAVFLIIWLCFLVGAVAFWKAQASVGPRIQQDVSDLFFTNGPVPSFKIEIKGTNLAALQRNNRAYVRATVKEGDSVYSNVGIHLKGAAGSFRELNDNPALTINFDKFKE